MLSIYERALSYYLTFPKVFLKNYAFYFDKSIYEISRMYLINSNDFLKIEEYCLKLKKDVLT